MDANSWAAEQQPAAGAEQRARPLQLSTSTATTSAGRCSSRASSTTNRDKFFFFWAQEWIRYDREETNTRTVPSAAMRAGDFSELLNPANPFFGRVGADPRPAHGPAVPGQRHPDRPAQPERGGPPEHVPAAHPGVPARRQQLDRHQPQPARHAQGHPAPRLHAERAEHRLVPRLALQLEGGGRVPRRLPPGPHRLGPAQPDRLAELDEHALAHRRSTRRPSAWSRDQVYIEVFRGTDSFERSKYGINYPYIFPGKEIEDKIPTISVAGFNSIDGGPYPASSVGPDLDVLGQPHLHPGPPHVQGRRLRGVLRRRRLRPDQRAASCPATRTTRTAASSSPTARTGGTGLAVANAAMGLFTNYGEIGARSKTDWRALAVDAFVQDRGR